MARIRSIHPGIFTDEAFVSVALEARLLFIGLWGEADDQGVFEWKPLTLKMRLFAADAIDVGKLLDAIQDAGMIRQFEVEGRLYGAIRNFCRYQRPKSPKAVHPLPDDLRGFVATSGKAEPGAPLAYPTDVTAAERKRRQREKSRDETPENGSCHGSTVTGTEVSRQMEDEGGRREEAKASKTRERAQTDAEFGGFWSAFPRRTGKGQAEKAYRTARQLASAEDIADGARRYAVERAGQDPKYTRIPSTWLNGKGWLDEVPANVVPIGRPRDLREIRDPVERARFQSF